GRLQASLASPVSAPAQETPEAGPSLTPAVTEMQIGHENLPAQASVEQAASGPATSAAVVRQPLAASDSFSLPALNTAESPLTGIAQSNPANAASMGGLRPLANFVPAVPFAVAETGRVLPPPGFSDADLDSLFLEIWDQDQMLFPDAVPATDEMLYPG